MLSEVNNETWRQKEKDERLWSVMIKGNRTFFCCLWIINIWGIIVLLALYIFIYDGTTRSPFFWLNKSSTHLPLDRLQPPAHRKNNARPNDFHIFGNLPFEIGLGRLFAGTWVASVCNFANVEDFNMALLLWNDRGYSNPGVAPAVITKRPSLFSFLFSAEEEKRKTWRPGQV